MIFMNTMKKMLCFLLAFMMVLGLTACGGASETAEPTAAAPVQATTPAVAENAVFRKLYASEVTTLNYLITTQENEMSIAANVVDCLVEYDNYGNIEPALALEWSSNEDATVWTFKLREDVKWVDKDGNEVAHLTAHDFVNSAHYVCDANNAAAGASQYTNIVAGAAEYNEWTAYQLALPNAVDGTDENGKAISTEEVNGAVHAYQHEIEGLPLAERFLRRICAENKLIAYVLNMTELHMKPNTMARVGSALKNTNKLFDRSVDPEALVLLALADDRGRILQNPAADTEAFLYERLDIFKEMMARPCVLGRDLIEAGIQPGKDFTEILEYAHKLRLAGIPKENALKQVLAFARQLRKGK